MRYIFGPVNSRRFGLSLGIDLSPEKKSCNFDCIYCELSPAKPVIVQENYPDAKEVALEVREALKRYPDIDVITITSNGEPTLYPQLGVLIDMLTKIKREKKLLILSNAALIWDREIQKDLAKCDIVKLSLDCATPRCFKRIDRPHKDLPIEKIIQGMIEFRKMYRGVLVIEILVVAGINDKIQEFKKLNDALQLIKPERVDIGTIDRPPAYNVQPVSYQKLLSLASYIENLPLFIVHRKKESKKPHHFSKEEILNTLRHRPLSQEDVATLFDKESLELLDKLIEQGVVEKITIANTTFFKLPTHH